MHYFANIQYNLVHKYIMITILQHKLKHFTYINSFNTKTTLRDWYNYDDYFHFTDKEIEDRQGRNGRDGI